MGGVRLRGRSGRGAEGLVDPQRMLQYRVGGGGGDGRRKSPTKTAAIAVTPTRGAAIGKSVARSAIVVHLLPRGPGSVPEMAGVDGDSIAGRPDAAIGGRYADEGGRRPRSEWTDDEGVGRPHDGPATALTGDTIVDGPAARRPRPCGPIALGVGVGQRRDHRPVRARAVRNRRLCLLRVFGGRLGRPGGAAGRLPLPEGPSP